MQTEARAGRGQAAVEYVIVLGALLTVVAALAWFVRAAERHGVRTEAIVTSDSP